MNKKVLISGLVLKLAFLTATAAFGQTPSFTPTPCQSLNYVFVGSANQGLAYDANANPYPTGWQSATYTPGSGWNPAQELSMPAVSNCGTGMISLIAAAPTPGPSQTFLHRNVFNLPSNTFFNNVPPTLVLGAADLAGVFSGGSAWVTVGVWMNNNLVGNFPLNAGCSIITVPSADFQTGTNVLAIQAWGGQWEVLDYSMPLSIVGCPAASPTASTTVTATFTRTPTLTPVNTSTVTPTATGANCCQGVSLALDQASYGNANGLGMDYAHNRVYVTDAENHVVKVYDLGTNGFLPDLTTGLSFPRDASLDGDGNVYIADMQSNGGDIVEFNSTGAWVANIGSGLVSRGIWAEGSGANVMLYVTSENNVVYQVSGSTHAVVHTYSGVSAGAASLASPTGLVKVQNFIYVADSFNGRIVRYDANNPSNPATVVLTGLILPAGINRDLAGNFYVTEANTTFVDRYDPTLTTRLGQCQVPNNPWGIVVSADGREIVSEVGLHQSRGMTVIQGCVLQPTLTASPAVTSTPTWTPGIPIFTKTPTRTLTGSSTWTPSRTPSFTGTIAVPPTQTFTRTYTRTFTGSVPVTVTTTQTPTNTPTNTPTSTASRTPTPTGGTAVWTLTWTPSPISTLPVTFTFTPVFTVPVTFTAVPSQGTAVATHTFTWTPTFTPTPIFTAPVTFTPVVDPTPVFDPTPVVGGPLTVTGYGCFAQSGDGGDFLPNGTVAPIVPAGAIPWNAPAPCGLQWISDNAAALAPGQTPSTVIFNRAFVLPANLLANGQFTLSFKADDAAQFFLNGQSVAAASCAPPVGNDGECQNYCHVFTIPASAFVAGYNTLQVKLINLFNVQVGNNFGWTSLSYSLCLSPVSQTGSPTPGVDPTPVGTVPVTFTAVPSQGTAIATWTPTNTPTYTPTWTPTFTPTPIFTAPVTFTPVVDPTPTYTPLTHVTVTPTPDKDRDHEGEGYPNPCSGDHIRFYYGFGPYQQIHVKIYSLGFRLVCHREHFCSGQTFEEVIWDLRDNNGLRVGNGIYYVQSECRVGNHVHRCLKKVMILR